MYDIIVKNLPLTSDEVELIQVALERYQETTVSVGESKSVEVLLDKLNNIESTF